MMFIRSGQKAGIYLLSLAVHVVNAWGESNTLLPGVFTPTLCCIHSNIVLYSLQHCAAWCIHSNALLPSVFTPTPTLAEYGRILTEYSRTLCIAADGILPYIAAYCPHIAVVGRIW